MKKLLCILTAICILAMTMGSVVMAEGETTEETYTNLVLNVTDAVKTNNTYTKYPIANLNDGNYANFATMRSSQTAQYISASLSRSSYIDHIVIIVHANTDSDKYFDNITYSLTGEDDSWESVDYSLTKETITLENSDTQAVKRTYAFNKNIVATHIKVSASTLGNDIHVREFEVYGSTALPYLKALTPDEGELTPAFDMNTTSYKVQVEALNDLPELTHETYTSDATVNITAADEANDYTAAYVVEHDGKTTTYTVQFVEYNWALAANGATVSEVGGRGKGFEPEKAVDGSFSSAWHCDDDKTTENYVQVKLANPTAIERIDFYTNNASSSYFAVYCSVSGEDGSWTQATHTPCGSASAPYKYTISLDGVAAQYIKLVPVKDKGWLAVYEIEVYGKAITDTYTTNCAISGNKLVGNVTFLNNTAVDENDKYYLMAVYVNGALYDVVPSNKSENSIAAGAAAGTKLTSSTLPSSGTVTAKLFVWDTPTTLVPVTITPLTLK